MINSAVTIRNITFTVTPSDTLYQYTYVDIRCNVTLSDDVDTPYTIMRQWLGPFLLTSGADYTIANDTLRINQLIISRDNGRIITCLVTVIPSAGYPYVLQNSVNGSTLLTVEGQL